MGRLCFVWGILYLMFFLGSRRKAVRGILFAAGAIAAAAGIELMTSFWASGSHAESFIPFGTRVWAWVAIAALPLAVAAFHGHKGLIPIAAAIGFAIALPWCYFTSIDTYSYKNGPMIAHVETRPNLLAHALVAAFAVFLCWWGVRLASRALVNLGIVGFAAAVAWFYFSDIFNKVGRSLGLIGLGVLFLAGGWALEKMRRRILAGMDSADRAAQEAK
jgi:TRAP-type C4-dicarboxylate transport system permease small subunit